MNKFSLHIFKRIRVGIYAVYSVFLVTVANFTFAASGGSQAFTVTLKNPLGSTETLYAFIQKILKLAVDIGTPVAVLFIIYAGFLFVSAQGSEDKITKAKNAFMWAIVGAGIILLAQVIATALEGTINSLK